jgi:hypothetical protein
MSQNRLKKMTVAVSAVLIAGVAFNLPAYAQSVGTPQWTSYNVLACNGSYYVTWSSVAGATSYEIWANYPPYAGYSLLKTITGKTSTSLRAANSTQSSYFEVEACIGTTCSPPSGPLELPYYSGCP